jgi:hypothetical protein
VLDLVNPIRPGRLIACEVAPGTKAVVTSGGFFSSSILVIEGPNNGCRGDLENEHFKWVRA